MFEFRYVELMNWAFWPSVKVPLDQRTIMITGPNGSGKTTFLDALRTLLRAPRLSANRRFNDYLMGNVDTAVVKAVVTNDYHQREHRPFEFKGFKGELVTMAVVMKHRAGRWEKRFALLDGDVPLEALRDLSRGDWLTPESYTREVEEAGFGAAFLKVLALEQGQTDKLCEKNPAELLDLLLDVHGDKVVIERYKRAKENYQVANLELSQLGARLAEEQAHLLTSQKKAEDFLRFRKYNEELRQFETVLIPQAEYKAALRQVDEANLAINDLNLKLRPIDREILEIEEVLDNAETDLQRRKNAVVGAREIQMELEKKERELDISLNTLVQERNRLIALLERARDLKEEPLDRLRQQLDECQHEIVRLELRQEETTARLREAQERARELKEPRAKIYPGYVEEFLRLLAKEKIAATLLCDIIEITDQSWQLAVESILGRDRFTVLVPPAHQLAARQLGERFRYRHYVVGRSTGQPRVSGKTPANAAIGVVQFTEDGAPDWVVEVLSRTALVESVADGMKLGADAVSVTRQGYRQDRRGGISIAVDNVYCGSLGQNAQREELKAAATRAAGLAETYRAELEKQRAAAAALTQRIQDQEALREGLQARERRDAMDNEIAAANTAHKEALVLRRDAERQLLDGLNELNNYERDLEQKRQNLLQRRGSQSEWLDEIKDRQDEIRRLKDMMAGIAAKLTPDQLGERALRQVPALDEMTPKYYAVKNLLAEFAVVPEATAVEVYEHHKTQYERQRRLYQDHEAGLRNWENEFRLARQKYVMVVEHTMREYRKNILSLAELAGVDAEVTPPDLREHDEVLETAGLAVRFGFDGKRAVDISGSQHSGGQRVVASLILLMSLATSGGVNRGGFFIIDEPFAHLSLERIDDVSRFLDKTECQFILTSPTTHNVNVFNAARLLINFRIKKPGADYAPLPTIIRR